MTSTFDTRLNSILPFGEIIHVSCRNAIILGRWNYALRRPIRHDVIWRRRSIYFNARGVYAGKNVFSRKTLLRFLSFFSVRLTRFLGRDSDTMRVIRSKIYNLCKFKTRECSRCAAFSFSSNCAKSRRALRVYYMHTALPIFMQFRGIHKFIGCAVCRRGLVEYLKYYQTFWVVV